MSVTEAGVMGGGMYEAIPLESMIEFQERRTRVDDVAIQSRPCGCPRSSSACPDPNELVSGSKFEDMPCDILIGKLALQEKRITGNADASHGIYI